jgi:DNA modification methylase
MPEVPVMVARGWSDAQRRAYVIADNKLALNAEWDAEVLAVELDELRDVGFDLNLVGFDAGELDDLIGSEGEVASNDAAADDVPDVEDAATTRLGDVWLLGEHRLMCGDSTSGNDVKRLIGDARATLLHADPPYGMGKEADGVQNDNLYGSALDEFQMAWWRAWRPFLTDNASAYIWGNAADLWRLWYLGGLCDSEALTIRNEIVWDKQSIAGMRSPELMQYPVASERCLFFQFGRYVFLVNQTIEDYWEGWEDIRLWLCAERDKAGFGHADVKRICGNHMYGHWFSKSQWAFISRENYEKLADAADGKAFARPYADLLAEYRRAYEIFRGDVREPRAEEFRLGRPYFDNAHDTMRDTWTFPRVSGEERFGHATPKPVAMIDRALRSASREGDVILEPFCGSGSTLIAAERCGRRCHTAELDPRYVDVTVRRWQAFTGKSARLEGDGRTFDEVLSARTQAET